MTTVTLQEAQANLPELIDRLPPGEVLVIVRGDQPVAKLVAESPHGRCARQPGMGRDQILFIADDFDAPLEDFREYTW